MTNFEIYHFQSYTDDLDKSHLDETFTDSAYMTARHFETSTDFTEYSNLSPDASYEADTAAASIIPETGDLDSISALESMSSGDSPRLEGGFEMAPIEVGGDLETIPEGDESRYVSPQSSGRLSRDTFDIEITESCNIYSPGVEKQQEKELSPEIFEKLMTNLTFSEERDVSQPNFESVTKMKKKRKQKRKSGDGDDSDSDTTSSDEDYSELNVCEKVQNEVQFSKLQKASPDPETISIRVPGSEEDLSSNSVANNAADVESASTISTTYLEQLEKKKSGAILDTSTSEDSKNLSEQSEKDTPWAEGKVVSLPLDEKASEMMWDPDRDYLKVTDSAEQLRQLESKKYLENWERETALANIRIQDMDVTEASELSMLKTPKSESESMLQTERDWGRAKFQDYTTYETSSKTQAEPDGQDGPIVHVSKKSLELADVKDEDFQLGKAIEYDFDYDVHRGKKSLVKRKPLNSWAEVKVRDYEIIESPEHISERSVKTERMFLGEPPRSDYVEILDKEHIFETQTAEDNNMDNQDYLTEFHREQNDIQSPEFLVESLTSNANIDPHKFKESTEVTESITKKAPDSKWSNDFTNNNNNNLPFDSKYHPKRDILTTKKERIQVTESVAHVNIDELEAEMLQETNSLEYIEQEVTISKYKHMNQLYDVPTISESESTEEEDCSDSIKAHVEPRIRFQTSRDLTKTWTKSTHGATMESLVDSSSDEAESRTNGDKSFDKGDRDKEKRKVIVTKKITKETTEEADEVDNSSSKTRMSSPFSYSRYERPKTEESSQAPKSILRKKVNRSNISESIHSDLITREHDVNFVQHNISSPKPNFDLNRKNYVSFNDSESSSGDSMKYWTCQTFTLVDFWQHNSADPNITTSRAPNTKYNVNILKNQSIGVGDPAGSRTSIFGLQNNSSFYETILKRESRRKFYEISPKTCKETLI